MNLVYEATKERGMTIVIPSALADSMSPAGLGGLLAAATASEREHGIKPLETAALG